MASSSLLVPRVGMVTTLYSQSVGVGLGRAAKLSNREEDAGPAPAASVVPGSLALRPWLPRPAARVPSAVPLRVAAETSRRLAGLPPSRCGIKTLWQPRGRSVLPEHESAAERRAGVPRSEPGTTIPRMPRGLETRPPAARQTSLDYLLLWSHSFIQQMK